MNIETIIIDLLSWKNSQSEPNDRTLFKKILSLINKNNNDLDEFFDERKTPDRIALYKKYPCYLIYAVQGLVELRNANNVYKVKAIITNFIHSMLSYNNNNDKYIDKYIELEHKVSLYVDLYGIGPNVKINSTEQLSTNISSRDELMLQFVANVYIKNPCDKNYEDHVKRGYLYADEIMRINNNGISW